MSPKSFSDCQGRSLRALLTAYGVGSMTLTCSPVGSTRIGCH